MVKKDRTFNLDISTKWLGLNLKNPIVLGSMTFISHSRVQEQIDYYLKAEQMGAGAIVLESFVPIAFGNEKIAYRQNDLVPIKSGLKKNEYMGFALLGPPYPNIVSIKYGKTLISQLKKVSTVPIIGSIVNFGTYQLMVDSAIELRNAGVDALEINFSCPNLRMPPKEIENKNYSLVEPTIGLIRDIKEKSGLKISLKIAPDNDYILNLIETDKETLEIVDSITYSNAYLGLTPPSLFYPFAGTFGRGTDWSYTGIYGPLERQFTYLKLAKLKKSPTFFNKDVSIVGGIVNEDQVIESILLGATTIQFASGVLWKSLELIKNSIKRIKNFMIQNSFTTIKDFSGISLRYLKEQADDVYDYKIDISTDKVSRYQKQRSITEKTEKCKKCGKCAYTACLAIKITTQGDVFVDSDLCSGCGWCIVICPIPGAIRRVNSSDNC